MKSQNQRAPHDEDDAAFLTQRQHALELIKKGHHTEAEAIYREWVAEGREDAGILSNLAGLCGMAGRREERRWLLMRAIALNSDHAPTHVNLGVAHDEDGDIKNAIREFEIALKLQPDLPEARANLTRCQLRIQNFDQAINILSCSNHQQIDCTSLWMEVGKACQLLGRHEQALGFLQEGLLCKDETTELNRQLGWSLLLLGRLEEAALQYSLVLARRDADADALNQLGVCLHRLQDTDQALALHRKAIEADPESTRSYILLGNVLCARGDLEDALSSCKKALEIDPGNVDARMAIAIILKERGYVEEAMDMLEILIHEDSLNRGAWQNLLFIHSIIMLEKGQKMLATSQRYFTLCLEDACNMPAQSSDPSHRKDRDKDKIYIGILTAELGNHVVSLFLDSFLEHYDATRFHLSLISTCRWHQSREKSLIDKADEYITIEGLSDAEARIQIRSLDLDIVIETSGFTKDSRIEVLAERCAPVQCHYIGFHATTGFDTIDYVIGDEEVASAEFNQQFTEKLIRMPRAWLACRPFEQQPLAVATCTEPYPVMGCFSQLAKIRDETLTFWAAALKQVPDARLVIKDKLVNDDAARHRILASLASLGISDARIQFLPHSDTWLEHMRLYNSIDIALDTTPWGSSTTAFDALSMGVPLVVIRGNCMPARMSSSIVKAIGRAEWVSGSPDQFAQVVGVLCNDLPSLRASKGALQRHVLNGPLFDGADLSSHLQEVLTTLAGAEYDRVQHSDQTDA